MAGCSASSRPRCTAEKAFLFINVAFAVYAGALLSTGARLAWDPSTYAWFRYLCAAQYRVSCAYCAAAGGALLALACLGVGGARRRRALHAYCAGVAGLAASELAYTAWMAASLAAWWRHSPRAELARRALDLLHDLKPALRAMERHRDVTRPVLDMLEEVEREAPNNVYVIIVFGLVGLVLQVAAVVVARRLARAPRPREAPEEKACDDDSDDSAPDLAPPSPGWRKNANLRMYTILDKIF